MRFLGVGDFCELSGLYKRLVEEGHDVKIDISEKLSRDTLSGIVARTDDWRQELSWIRAAGRDGIILFENVSHGRGALQDQLRSEGYQVIGGSAFGDRLENDRPFAQQVLRDAGLQTGGMWNFGDRPAALRFVAENPARYVLKFNGPYGPTYSYVGQFHDGADIAAFIRGLPAADQTTFVLMEFLQGVEMGVGAYFNGECFLRPACLDWEHKRFFPGNRGELTSEMGTVVTYERTSHFFEMTLMRIEPLLRQQSYCGYINLNTIVNDRGIWPLEFTCRFGYPGFSILEPLQKCAWSTLFKAMLDRDRTTFDAGPGFAVGIVLTTPPFPYDRVRVNEPVGLPVTCSGSLSDDDRRNIHYGEVGLQNGQLVTAGIWGTTMVVTGVGRSVAAARARANELASRIQIPNVRYRDDIGAQVDLAAIERLGLFGGPTSRRREVRSRRIVELA